MRQVSHQVEVLTLQVTPRFDAVRPDDTDTLAKRIESLRHRHWVLEVVGGVLVAQEGASRARCILAVILALANMQGKVLEQLELLLVLPTLAIFYVLGERHGVDENRLSELEVHCELEVRCEQLGAVHDVACLLREVSGIWVWTLECTKNRCRFDRL